MIIKDRVYGTEEINEDVFIDLINSPEFQRLKNVSQLGLPDEYYSKKNFSRYEHSLGVFVLLRRLGAGIDEQIAGLLHDINHKAFSHVIDWIFGDPTKENHQDEDYANFLENSGIPDILERHGFNYIDILNLEKFSLLEREAPSLCADRIDYSLRELAVDGRESLAKKIFENLIVLNNQIIFESQSIAEIFHKEYSFLNETSWSGEDSRMRYSILSDVLKRGFDKGLLDVGEMVDAEYKILKKLEDSGDLFIVESLNLLKEGFDLVEDSKGIELKTKYRYIDPELKVEKSYKKLSEVSQKHFELIEEGKSNSNNFVRMRAVKIK